MGSGCKSVPSVTECLNFYIVVAINIYREEILHLAIAAQFCTVCLSSNKY